MKIFDPRSPGWCSGAGVPLARLVLEAALEVELVAHLGYPKHGSHGRLAGSNSRNGARVKRVQTIFGPVEVKVPRDRWGTFQPVTIGKWQRQVAGLDRLVLALAARGTPLANRVELLGTVYSSSFGAPVIAEIAASVHRHTSAWHERSLSGSYPLLVGDRVSVSLPLQSDASRPVHTILGVTPQGGAELLGVWASSGRSVAEGWRHIASDLACRGVRDVSTVVSLDPTDVENLAFGWPGAHVAQPSPHDGGEVGWQRSI